MKKQLNSLFLPLLIFLLGILGALFRGIYYAIGVDSRGLLVKYTFPHIALLAITFLVIILLIVLTARLKQASKYAFNFPSSPLGAMGAAIAAGGFILASTLLLIADNSTFAALTAILGYVGAVSLGFLSYFRHKGIRPAFAFSAIICIFFLVRLIYCYRLWSANPQLQDYLFPLLANIGAMLACYHGAAFSDGASSRRLHTLYHLATIYCAIVSLPHCDNPIFYAAITIWMLSNLCNLTPMPKEY